MRSPDEALDEIERQQTHNLYCPKCKSNITTSTKLFPRGNQTYPYNKKIFVLSFPRNLGGLNTPSSWFRLVVVLLLLIIMAMWSTLSHIQPPEPHPPLLPSESPFSPLLSDPFSTLSPMNSFLGPRSPSSPPGPQLPSSPQNTQPDPLSHPILPHQRSNQLFFPSPPNLHKEEPLSSLALINQPTIQLPTDLLTYTSTLESHSSLSPPESPSSPLPLKSPSSPSPPSPPESPSSPSPPESYSSLESPSSSSPPKLPSTPSLSNLLSPLPMHDIPSLLLQPSPPSPPLYVHSDVPSPPASPSFQSNLSSHLVLPHQHSNQLFSPLPPNLHNEEPLSPIATINRPTLQLPSNSPTYTTPPESPSSPSPLESLSSPESPSSSSPSRLPTAPSLSNLLSPLSTHDLPSLPLRLSPPSPPPYAHSDVPSPPASPSFQSNLPSHLVLPHQHSNQLFSPSPPNPHNEEPLSPLAVINRPTLQLPSNLPTYITPPESPLSPSSSSLPRLLTAPSLSNLLSPLPTHDLPSLPLQPSPPSPPPYVHSDVPSPPASPSFQSNLPSHLVITHQHSNQLFSPSPPNPHNEEQLSPLAAINRPTLQLPSNLPTYTTPPESSPSPSSLSSPRLPTAPSLFNLLSPLSTHDLPSLPLQHSSQSPPPYVHSDVHSPLPSPIFQSNLPSHLVPPHQHSYQLFSPSSPNLHTEEPLSPLAAINRPTLQLPSNLPTYTTPPESSSSPSSPRLPTAPSLYNLLSPLSTYDLHSLPLQHSSPSPPPYVHSDVHSPPPSPSFHSNLPSHLVPPHQHSYQLFSPSSPNLHTKEPLSPLAAINRPTLQLPSDLPTYTTRRESPSSPSPLEPPSSPESPSSSSPQRLACVPSLSNILSPLSTHDLTLPLQPSPPSPPPYLCSYVPSPPASPSFQSNLPSHLVLPHQHSNQLFSPSPSNPHNEEPISSLAAINRPTLQLPSDLPTYTTPLKSPSSPLPPESPSYLESPSSSSPPRLPYAPSLSNLVSPLSMHDLPSLPLQPSPPSLPPYVHSDVPSPPSSPSFQSNLPSHLVLPHQHLNRLFSSSPPNPHNEVSLSPLAAINRLTLQLPSDLPTYTTPPESPSSLESPSSSSPPRLPSAPSLSNFISPQSMHDLPSLPLPPSPPSPPYVFSDVHRPLSSPILHSNPPSHLILSNQHSNQPLSISPPSSHNQDLLSPLPTYRHSLQLPLDLSTYTSPPKSPLSLLLPRPHSPLLPPNPPSPLTQLITHPPLFRPNQPSPLCTLSPPLQLNSLPQLGLSSPTPLPDPSYPTLPPSLLSLPAPPDRLSHIPLLDMLSPLPLERPHLCDEIDFICFWVIHFLSMKYLFASTLLFLTILAVQWPSISTNIKDYLQNYIVVSIQKILHIELDILKSIVYGGLIESITSLGVVSCAAGSGTSTLNVLALAIANLFTGLILIIQKLHVLIMNKPQSHNANNDIVMISDKEDLYKAMLGNKDKCKFHCVVSFIFLGLIPPLFYGLSFKRTDEGLYKVAIVLSASLICVISLSFAKQYAFELKERWIVPVYTGMAVGASVLSFIASQFLSNLLEKYDFRELASDYSKD